MKSRAVTIRMVRLALIRFFLPWVQMSCGVSENGAAVWSSLMMNAVNLVDPFSYGNSTRKRNTDAWPGLVGLH